MDSQRRNLIVQHFDSANRMLSTRRTLFLGLLYLSLWNERSIVSCAYPGFVRAPLSHGRVGICHRCRSQCCRTGRTSLGQTGGEVSADVQRKNLQELTVKELRQMVKESHRNERGVLSRLKLKQDLIDFLGRETDNEAQEGQKERTEARTPRKIKLASSSTVTRATPMRMPSMKQARSADSLYSSSSALPDVSPKERIFEKVYAQYPILRSQNCTGIGDQDIRQTYHPVFEGNSASSDMDLIFVGTASCTPGVTRGVACTALRLNWQRRSVHGVPDGHRTADAASSFRGGTWLFDCGECTQLQVQRTSSVRPGKITKIFITHAHGDHSFGLPGLLCLMGQDRDRESAPVDIYGPEGLRMWLRVAIRYSVSRIVPPYRVHELKDVPMAPEWEYSRRANRYFYRGLAKKDPNTIQWGHQGLPGEDPESWISRASMMNLEPSLQYGEVDGGRDVFPIYGHPRAFDNAPVWEVEDEDDVKVFAAPMSHGIPCVGYVVEERTQPGRLRDEVVRPIVERNLHALKEAGFGIPMKAMSVIKNLPIGSVFTFPDGTILTQEEAVEAPRNGRKIVICGDSANCRAISGLAQGADILVHEATNSFLAGVDKDTNLRAVTRDAIVHGHSTPIMAGEFAKKIRARKLLLNHFSARYKGDQSVDSLSIMMRIEGQAMKASGLNSSRVAATWDMMVLPVPRN